MSFLNFVLGGLGHLFPGSAGCQGVFMYAKNMENNQRHKKN